MITVAENHYSHWRVETANGEVESHSLICIFGQTPGASVKVNGLHVTKNHLFQVMIIRTGNVARLEQQLVIQLGCGVILELLGDERPSPSLLVNVL